MSRGRDDTEVLEMADVAAVIGCEQSWSRGSWKCFIWLFAILFVSVSESSRHFRQKLWQLIVAPVTLVRPYGVPSRWRSTGLSALRWNARPGKSLTKFRYRQLLDPSSVVQRRSRIQDGQQAYPLQPQAPYQGHPDYPLASYGGGDYAGVGSQGYVPPYPGPPPADSPYAPKNGDGDAKELDGRDMTYEAQERAWQQAQRDGPTAHSGAASEYSAPDGPPPRDRGRNEEEDDAWRLATEQGPTAHLTGDTIRQGGARV